MQNLSNLQCVLSPFADSQCSKLAAGRHGGRGDDLVEDLVDELLHVAGVRPVLGAEQLEA